ncbi:MAG: tetratricopeptide repeat protein [Sulfurimonas sp.]
MTLFQLLMLGASAFFAFKIYQHIQTLKDPQGGERFEDPADIDLLIAAGDEEMQKGDFQKALAIYSEADYKVPNNAEVLFKIGYALIEQERYDEAVDSFKAILRLDDNNPAVYQALASVYRKMGQFEDAKYNLDAALLINDKNPITYYNYGNLLVDMDNDEDAKEMYAKAIELDPDFKEAKEELEKLA